MLVSHKQTDVRQERSQQTSTCRYRTDSATPQRNMMTAMNESAAALRSIRTTLNLNTTHRDINTPPVELRFSWSALNHTSWLLHQKGKNKPNCNTYMTLITSEISVNVHVHNKGSLKMCRTLESLLFSLLKILVPKHSELVFADITCLQKNTWHLWFEELLC